MSANVITSDRCGFVARDGVELSYCLWRRTDSVPTRAIVLILHGIGFHSQPYKVLADNLDVPGLMFAGLDFRGHGLSGGTKGEMGPLRQVLGDIEDWVTHVETSYPGIDMYLFAESMAGPYGTLFAAENPDAFKGIMLVAPAVIPSWRQVIHGSTLKDIFGLIRNPSKSRLNLGGDRLNAGLDDGVVVVRAEDDLAIQAVSPGYMMRVGQTMTRLLGKRSISVNAPVLIVHGARDNILSPMGSRYLLRRFRSPQKRLVILPDAVHTLMWDSSSPVLFRTLESWMASQLDGRIPFDHIEPER